MRRQIPVLPGQRGTVDCDSPGILLWDVSTWPRRTALNPVALSHRGARSSPGIGGLSAVILRGHTEGGQVFPTPEQEQSGASSRLFPIGQQGWRGSLGPLGPCTSIHQQPPRPLTDWPGSTGPASGLVLGTSSPSWSEPGPREASSEPLASLEHLWPHCISGSHPEWRRCVPSVEQQRATLPAPLHPKTRPPRPFSALRGLQETDTWFSKARTMS